MTDAVRHQMWQAIAENPVLMVQRTASGEHSEPMLAQVDPEAESCFWFYTNRANRIAPGGPAMAHFVAPEHNLFCCISGTLHEERDPAVIDRYWSKAVEAWYEGGRQDPSLLMLRFDLGEAEIWTQDASIRGLFKLMSGKTISARELGQHAKIRLTRP